jgi:hypothetical protein
MSIDARDWIDLDRYVQRQLPFPVKNYRDLILSDLSNPRILVVVVVPEQIDDWIEQTHNAW